MDTAIAGSAVDANHLRALTTALNAKVHVRGPTACRARRRACSTTPTSVELSTIATERAIASATLNIDRAFRTCQYAFVTGHARNSDGPFVKITLKTCIGI
jgi:hypothetical protein